MWDDLNFNRTPFKQIEPSIYCNAWVATAIIGAGAVGAAATIYSANSAAGAQNNAANDANARLTQQYNQTREDLSPYRDIGQTASTELTNQLPVLTSQQDITSQINDPNSVPGRAYNFTSTQGQKAVSNSVAARGLGVSGAALKGAASFATGLADNTYTNLFNMGQTQQTNAYNRLKGLVDTGENAGAQTGVIGNANATAQSGNTIGAGNASAAAANATGGAISNLSNNIGGYAAYKGLYGSNGTTDYSGVTPAQTSYWASGNTGPVGP